MNRRYVLAACLLLVACKRQASEADTAREEAADLLSAFSVTEAQAAPQMTHGFHAVENGWRWTEGKFGVTLAPPEGSTARLELKFALPAAVTDRMGPVTLTATVNGRALLPETYKSPGDQVFARDLGAVGPGPVSVEFATDKALPPGNGDARELALIVTAVGLK